MTDEPDGGAAAVEDGRRAPFCFQTHDALDRIREHYQGAKRTTALAVYLSLTEAANRAGGAAARGGFSASRKEIAGAAGISVDTLDRYVADLVKIGLVEARRRAVEGVNLPNTWVLLDPLPVPPVAARVRPGGSRTGAAQGPKKRTREEGEPTAPARGGADGGGPDPERPPSVVYVDGRNLALDALADECGLDPDSPRLGQAVAALNGARGQQGIRHLCWRELIRWADENGRTAELATLYDDPERFTRALEQAIRRKCALYRDRMDGAHLTPTALRDWWLDLEKTPGRRAGLSPDEIEAFAG